MIDSCSATALVVRTTVKLPGKTDRARRLRRNTAILQMRLHAPYHSHHVQSGRKEFSYGMRWPR